MQLPAERIESYGSAFDPETAGSALGGEPVRPATTGRSGQEEVRLDPDRRSSTARVPRPARPRVRRSAEADDLRARMYPPLAALADKLIDDMATSPSEALTTTACSACSSTATSTCRPSTEPTSGQCSTQPRSNGPLDRRPRRRVRAHVGRAPGPGPTCSPILTPVRRGGPNGTVRSAPACASLLVPGHEAWDRGTGDGRGGSRTGSEVAVPGDLRRRLPRPLSASPIARRCAGPGAGGPAGGACPRTRFIHGNMLPERAGDPLRRLRGRTPAPPTRTSGTAPPPCPVPATTRRRHGPLRRLLQHHQQPAER